MNEKTFRDMLPLTDEQREFLGDSNNNIRCSRCFLSANRVGNTLCGDFVKGKMWVDFTCSDVRAEALRLDDEYRKANMENEILSQEEFASLPGCEINGYSPWWEAACKSHVALLDTVADLKKLYAMRKDKIYELEKEIEGGSDKIRELSFERAELTVKLEECEKSHAAAALERIDTLEKIVDNLSVQIDRRDMDWHSERKRFNECIAELEERKKQLEDGWLNDKNKYEDKIAELESRLAEYEGETETADTWVEASEKCKEKANDLAKNGNPAIFEVEQNCFVLNTMDERFEFPYSEPSEPQTGDFMINGSGNAFTFSHYCCDDDGCSFDIDGGTHDNIKPTGYRVNENGDIVKIKRGDK